MISHIMRKTWETCDKKRLSEHWVTYTSGRCVHYWTFDKLPKTVTDFLNRGTATNSHTLPDKGRHKNIVVEFIEIEGGEA